jgi:O-methyltransferase
VVLTDIKQRLPDPVRLVARRTKRRFDDLRIGAADALAPSGIFTSELAPAHGNTRDLASARGYNRQRSRESKYSVRDTNRFLMLSLVTGMVGSCQEGDYAEVGTYRGMTAQIIWQNRVIGSRLFCFDTFEGFAKSDCVSDGESIIVEDELQRFRDTSVGLVERYIGGPSPDLILRVGCFPSTFEGLEDKLFRLVHVDCDLYEPVLASLETFWPRVVEGGAVLIHDYLSPRYPRCKEAVDSFFGPLGIRVLPLNDRVGTAVVVRQRGMI